MTTACSPDPEPKEWSVVTLHGTGHTATCDCGHVIKRRGLLDLVRPMTDHDMRSHPERVGRSSDSASTARSYDLT